jgi:hypothetical protein
MSKLFKLKEKDIELLLQIEKRGKVTKKSSEYGGLQYYMSVWRLRDLGLIKVKYTDATNQKVWELNTKGKETVAHIKAIREIIENEK